SRSRPRSARRPVFSLIGTSGVIAETSSASSSLSDDSKVSGSVSVSSARILSSSRSGGWCGTSTSEPATDARQVIGRRERRERCRRCERRGLLTGRVPGVHVGILDNIARQFGIADDPARKGDQRRLDRENWRPEGGRIRPCPGRLPHECPFLRPSSPLSTPHLSLPPPMPGPP